MTDKTNKLKKLTYFPLKQMELNSYPRRGLRYWTDKNGVPRSSYIINCLTCAIYLNDDRIHIVRCPRCTVLYQKQKE